MPGVQSTKYHHTLIIGCGVSGIGSAAYLKRWLNLEDVHIFERYAEPGGVWAINNPGAACDIPASLYSYSFAQRRDWPKAWPGQDVIQSYYANVWRRFGLQNKTSFRTEVVCCKFDNTTNLWHVWTRPAHQPANDARKDSKPEPVNFDDLEGAGYDHWVSKVLINAVGGLSEPNKCNVPGAETFEGPIFHSARWDTSVDMSDKRIVLLGNGCSGAQIVQELSPRAKHITQLGRSKHWYIPIETNLDSFPYRLLRWFFPSVIRTIIFFVLEFHFRAFRKVAGRAHRNRTANKSIRHIKKTAPAKYHDILIPDQKTLEVGCKRRIIDQGYLKALNNPNVDLKAQGAAEIRPHSVILDSGEEVPADVVVLATGFSIRESGGQLRIIGRDGKSDINTFLLQQYKEPSTYRSTMIESFPNMFMIMTGFNSGTGHSSVVFTAECQMEWMIRVGRDLFNERSRPSPEALVYGGSDARQRFPTIEPKRSAQVKEMLWMQEKMQDYVFAGNCGAWYIDPISGAIASMYAGSQVDFWRRSRFPRHDDLLYRDFPGEADSKSNLHKPSRTWSEWFGNLLGLGDVGEPKTQIGRQFQGGKIIKSGP
ncbi:hypothetical protein OC845_002165 [Tilletia horrida]|nr:hypothetical protein OC845_002165 [Tilletia horrida]